jgi:hypothetical protein
LFLKVKDLEMPKDLEWCALTNRADAAPDDPWAEIEGVPDNLVPMGKADWPVEVKKEIAQAFMEIGLEDPLRQKLVEPYAVAFGGEPRNGAYDFTGVNWEMAVEYFKYEAANYDFPVDHEKIEAMQQAAEKKYGGRFFHYSVYEVWVGV